MTFELLQGVRYYGTCSPLDTEKGRGRGCSFSLGFGHVS